MDRVFNLGVGMALVVDPAAVGEALDVLASAGQPSTVIGTVVGAAHRACASRERHRAPAARPPAGALRRGGTSF